MSTSVFNLKTQVLNSSERTTVKRADFEITGDKMQFEMLTRKGTLEGNVKMVVRGKSRAPGMKANEKAWRWFAQFSASALLAGIARGQGSAPATLSSRTPSQPSEKARPPKPAERSPSEKNPAEKPKDAKSACGRRGTDRHRNLCRPDRLRFGEIDRHFHRTRRRHRSALSISRETS